MSLVRGGIKPLYISHEHSRDKAKKAGQFIKDEVNINIHAREIHFDRYVNDIDDNFFSSSDLSA